MRWPKWLFGKKEQKVVDKQVVLKRNMVLGKLLEVFPELNPLCLWPADSAYVMPTEKELKELLSLSTIESYDYVKDIQDCDDYALRLHAYVIEDRYKAFKEGRIVEGLRHSLAFGQIWYKDLRIGYHAVNICITCDKGVLLIEPQNDKIFKPKKNAVVSFIRM